jgi:general stress protein YciG
MPKPVKKKPATKKRPSADPNARAHQMIAEMEARQTAGPVQPQAVTPPHGDPFEAQYRARMAELGRKGGQIGGKRRMESMTEKERKDVARKAAKARWARGN